MVDKISQSMLSLAENNKEFKTALRFMLKCEIQLLLTRLAEIGDESLLIIANKSEESTSHFGSSAGESYLQTCLSSLNFSIKDTFLKHCLESQGKIVSSSVNPVPGQGQMKSSNFNPMLGQGQGQMSGDGQKMNSSMNPVSGQGQIMNNMNPVVGQGQMMNNINPMAGQGQMMNNNMNPMIGSNMNPMAGQANLSEILMKAAQITGMGFQGMMNNQMMGNYSMAGNMRQANRFNPYQQQHKRTAGTSPAQKASHTKQENKDLQLNRAICRHFAKGHCWQGNMCAFLHVHQEPDSSEDKDSKDTKSFSDTMQQAATGQKT